MTELRVRRDDPSRCELVEGEPADAELADSEARLRIERFALTTNNVTYARFGDEMGYWRPFPAPEGWGRIPAWGYVSVDASRSEAAAEGQRAFGLVPMGTHLTVRPQAIPFGFIDDVPNRAEMAPIYSQYTWFEGEGDDAGLIWRPLFGTSVVLDMALADSGVGAGATVVLTSASSKTAYGLAHLLRERGAAAIGLTSPGHRAWLEGLGVYDSVVAYGDADAIAVPDGAVLVDFAGDRALLRRLHERLGAQLSRSVLVGFTHHDGEPDEAPLPGPEPELFFAPDEIARRGRELAPRYVEGWQSFAPVVERAMRIERVTDGDGLVRAYLDLLHGRADPAVGYVVSL